MKRILLLGLCPLPTENESHTLGPGKRTWQFARALLEDGHRVCLVCSRHLAAYQSSQLPPITAIENRNLIYYSLTQSAFEDTQWFQRLHDCFEPDCIIGATVYPSFIATRLQTEKPIWADLFGHLMSEAQTKSLIYDDDYYLTQLWNCEKEVLDRADIFSVVSEPQAYATIGELGTRGRLNRHSTGYSFVRIIPCAINDIDTIDVHQNDRPIIRGSAVDPDDFVVLWSGGYNTWTDVKTLFNALEIAFRREPRIKFVSTGGQIGSHDELTYLNFTSMIEKSEFKDRFILKGWIPFHEVPLYWKESDVGINIDLFSYEGLLGSRNRILDWMQIGLPVLTTELCALSVEIKEKELGFTFTPENAQDLANILVHLSQNRELLKTTATRAKNHVENELGIMKTTEALRTWVNNPARSPDAHDNVPAFFSPFFSRTSLLQHYMASFKNQLKAGGLSGIVQRVCKTIPGKPKSIRRP